MKIIDNFEIAFENYSPEFEEFLNSEATESIEDIDALVEGLESELGLEAEEGGKLQKLWNIIRTIWNWILQKLKSTHVRMKKIRNKIKGFIKSKIGKLDKPIEGLINPEAIEEITEAYTRVIDILKSINKSVTVVTPNTVNELEELKSKLRRSINGIGTADFRKRFHKNVTIDDIKGLNRYLVSLDRASSKLEEARKQLMAVVFEIHNKCSKTSLESAQKGSGSEEDGFEITVLMSEITNLTKHTFEYMDKFETYIQSSLRALEGKDSPKIKSGDEGVESKLVEAIMEEYGVEGVTSIIRNLSSK